MKDADWERKLQLERLANIARADVAKLKLVAGEQWEWPEQNQFDAANASWAQTAYTLANMGELNTMLPDPNIDWSKVIFPDSMRRKIMEAVAAQKAAQKAQEAEKMRCQVCQHPIGEHNKQGCQHTDVDYIDITNFQGAIPRTIAQVLDCSCTLANPPEREHRKVELEPPTIDVPDLDDL